MPQSQARTTAKQAESVSRAAFGSKGWQGELRTHDRSSGETGSNPGASMMDRQDQIARSGAPRPQGCGRMGGFACTRGGASVSAGPRGLRAPSLSADARRELGIALAPTAWCSLLRVEEARLSASVVLLASDGAPRGASGAVVVKVAPPWTRTGGGRSTRASAPVTHGFGRQYRGRRRLGRGRSQVSRQGNHLAY